MIEVMIDDEVDASDIPPLAEIEAAVSAACHAAGFAGKEAELCIRFATNTEVHQLNRQYRQRDSVTDVLSFPAQQGENPDFTQPLGDIALAMPFVAGEAERLDLPLVDHMQHLIIHAVLHLLGFDHTEDEEAEQMQEMEREAMRRLGLHDPYPDLALAVEP